MDLDIFNEVSAIVYRNDLLLEASTGTLFTDSLFIVTRYLQMLSSIE